LFYRASEDHIEKNEDENDNEEEKDKEEDDIMVMKKSRFVWYGRSYGEYDRSCSSWMLMDMEMNFGESPWARTKI
jgi:hypothetical protein